VCELLDLVCELFDLVCELLYLVCALLDLVCDLYCYFLGNIMHHTYPQYITNLFSFI